MVNKRGLLIAAIACVLVLGTGVAYAADDPPPETAGARAAGKLTAIDLSASSFTMETLREKELTVVVSSSTEFRSRNEAIDGLEDLETGMPVIVVGTPNSKGELLANIVGVGKPGGAQRRFRLQGEIASVGSGEDIFSLRLRDGQELEIHVGEGTRFISRDGSIHGLEDFEAGMLARVQGLKRPDGQLQALVVAAGSPEDRPDIRAAGEITALQDGAFILAGRQGRSVTFNVDEATKYRSRDGNVLSFEDLEVGMKVVATGDEISEGTYRAIMVGVGAGQGAPAASPRGPLSGGPGA